ncbi:MAG TPA: PstS family phosphate ABC transporter substrate-binding protein [Thermoleophilaceae bacterium]|nr:PstS family phosphate ABC transporter substrate-binding protein [Thermoleophilaceae bacterium]
MRNWLALAAAGVMALSVAACGDDDENGGGGGGGGGGGDLSGNIRIDGSSTVQPFAEAAAELFNEENSGVKVTVGGAGSGDGFEKFCRGETQISDASRAIEEDETKLCKQGKVKPVEVQVANDGITVVTNKNLTVDCLTTGQLKKVFGKGAKANNLSEVDGKLADQELALFTPGTESGTFDFFTEQINGEEGVQRTEGIQTSADDNVLVTGVSGEDGGLGYFGFSFYEQNQDKLNAVGVDGGSGCVKPSAETIQSGEYKPLARPLFMYPSEASLKKPEVKAFLDFVAENYAEIAEAAKIVPMNEEQAREAKSAVGG